MFPDFTNDLSRMCGALPVSAEHAVGIAEAAERLKTRHRDLPGSYRKKPVVIQAVRWDGKLTTVEPLMIGLITPPIAQDLGDPALYIETLEGTHKCNLGDWIIRGVKGELYPCRDDIFRATYEPANDGEQLSRDLIEQARSEAVGG